MADNYEKIVKSNLERLYAGMPADLADRIPAEKDGDRFVFNAFGEKCVISPDGVMIGAGGHPTVLGIIISLYALHAKPDVCVTEPFKAFKDCPNSMPYVGAFTAHAEQILVPHAERLESAAPRIKAALNGGDAPESVSGDLAFVVYPLPKIALCYIVYEADEDFPASVTCLYAHNADLFLPVDALADTGEYTSRKIIALIEKA